MRKECTLEWVDDNGNVIPNSITKFPYDVVREHIDVIEVILCKDCRYLDVWNLKNIYAVCSKHGITFEPFEDDTRTCFCSWGERREP